MNEMSLGRQRLVALVLLLAVIVAVWGLVVLPVIDGFADRSVARDDLLATYIRNDRMVADIPAWRVEARRQKKTQAPFAIVVPAAGMGHEVLSKRLSRAVIAVGGTMLSSQTVRTRLPPDWAGVQSDIQLSIGQLAQILARLQNEEPYVVVDFISVGVIPPRQPGGLQNLAVRIAISAPLRIAPAPPGAGALARHA